jgi:Mrp family chromosome partitioning ATPase
MTAPAPPAVSSRIMAVTSGKGGVGKTFVSANLAAALARNGRRCWCWTPTWAWPTWTWC